MVFLHPKLLEILSPNCNYYFKGRGFIYLRQFKLTSFLHFYTKKYVKLYVAISLVCKIFFALPGDQKTLLADLQKRVEDFALVPFYLNLTPESTSTFPQLFHCNPEPFPDVLKELLYYLTLGLIEVKLHYFIFFYYFYFHFFLLPYGWYFNHNLQYFYVSS